MFSHFSDQEGKKAFFLLSTCFTLYYKQETHKSAKGK